VSERDRADTAEEPPHTRADAAVPADKPWLADLSALNRFAWRNLVRGVADRRAPLRNVQIGVVDHSGLPSVSTVVLRAASGDRATLTLYTDARSHKFAALQRDPRAAVHGYDDRQKLQLRLTGTCVIAQGAQAAGEWDRLGQGARAPFVQQTSPGQTVADPAQVATQSADTEMCVPGTFSCVTVQVLTLEVLVLDKHGHRRARFHFAPSVDGAAAVMESASWLAP